VIRTLIAIITSCLACFVLAGCGSNKNLTAPDQSAAAEVAATSEYIIGPGDSLNVFVWEHPDVSITVPVRPDGRISTPLVEDMQAVGKTPTQLARDMESALSEYIRSPAITIIVVNFVGTFGEQIRVVGQATSPQALPYSHQMTLLDVMIAVGGLTESAAGNRAKIIRRRNGETVEIPARIKDLLNSGKISENIVMQPGDVLIIPESWL
jgi:polysaccharide export outer membrane protein